MCRGRGRATLRGPWPCRQNRTRQKQDKPQHDGRRISFSPQCCESDGSRALGANTPHAAMQAGGKILRAPPLLGFRFDIASWALRWPCLGLYACEIGGVAGCSVETHACINYAFWHVAMCVHGRWAHVWIGYDPNNIDILFDHDHGHNGEWQHKENRSHHSSIAVSTSIQKLYSGGSIDICTRGFQRRKC